MFLEEFSCTMINRLQWLCHLLAAFSGEIPKIQNNSVDVSLTLVDETGKSQSAEFEFGEQATFRCSAQLETALQLSEQFEGISIIFHDNNGKRYQGGCLLYTNNHSIQTAFTSAENHCPTFKSGKLIYSAAINFQVTEHFVGKIDYTCQFHTRYRKHEESPWLSAISGESPALRIVGRRKPSITLVPRTLDGFGGDIVTVKCVIEKGYPLGTLVLLGKGNQSIHENIVKSEVTPEALRAQIRLTKALSGIQLVCYSSEHPNTKTYSQPIAVKFLEPLIETVQTIDVRSDMTLDCSTNIATNVRVKYQWMGGIVPPYSVQSVKPKLFVSHPYSTKYELLTCVVTSVNDPKKRQWKFQYIINFLKPAASRQERGLSGQVVAMFVIAALLLCGVMVLMFAGFIAHHYQTRRFSAKQQQQHYNQQRISAVALQHHR